MEHFSNIIRSEQMKSRDIGISDAKGLTEKIGSKDVNCEKHGTYVSNGLRLNIGKGRELWSTCPQCVEEAKRAEEQERKEKQAAVARLQLERALMRSGMPKRFHEKTFETFNVESDAQSSAYDVCKHYAENFKKLKESGASLVLAGMPGTGKSHLAASIMHHIMAEHVSQYMTCMDMIRAIRDTWRRDSERSEVQVLDNLTYVDLLVIDEIGVQYGTEGEQTIIFDVLDRRYREQMPVILLTNQDIKGFREFVGDRCYDRLKETGKWVAFDWSSYRSKARKDGQ